MPKGLRNTSLLTGFFLLGTHVHYEQLVLVSASGYCSNARDTRLTAIRFLWFHFRSDCQGCTFRFWNIFCTRWDQRGWQAWAAVMMQHCKTANSALAKGCSPQLSPDMSPRSPTNWQLSVLRHAAQTKDITHTCSDIKARTRSIRKTSLVPLKKRSPKSMEWFLLFIPDAGLHLIALKGTEVVRWQTCHPCLHHRPGKGDLICWHPTRATSKRFSSLFHCRFTLKWWAHAEWWSFF